MSISCWSKRLISAIVVVVSLVYIAKAQETTDRASLIQELVRQNAQLKEQNERLQDGLRALQERVSRLEAATPAVNGNAETDDHAPAAQQPAAAIVTAAPDDLHSHDLPFTGGLHFRGFVTGEFEASDAKGEKGSFKPAGLSLVMSDGLSDRWHALAEVNFDADDNFKTAVNVERLQLNYSANENFNLQFGRFHSDVSYFNTAFHHGRWLETATDRPHIVEFPDDGGLLPLHKTGIGANGLVPRSGSLGLHYFAEFGANPDFGNSANAVATGLFVRPTSLEGWQTGVSYQHARMSLANIPSRLDENIYGTHVVFRNSAWEFLNEGFLISHDVLGQRTFNTTGFYSLFSRRIRNWRPFFQYQYINANDLEPLYSVINRENGPSTGFRYDVAEHAAFKMEYFRFYHRHDDPTDKISIHMDWVF